MKLVLMALEQRGLLQMWEILAGKQVYNSYALANGSGAV